MNHQNYIDQAVKLAYENAEQGGKPFGAVIVKEGIIVATGINKATQSGDLTSHAEIEAIREAGLAGKADMLDGATLYASGHPCPMCLSAIYLANIQEVYYTGTLEEAEEVGLGVSHIYEELKKDTDKQSIPIRKLASTLDVDPMERWNNL
ncbi:nucleoside deaminase [Aliifodinibius sp. S!AR15-10]|uniref:nucleoside deaminase n=1 Tax=Aliifodinibius sp. S!AR15-10 TaxID=2950437 RepID=UPI00285644EB|nr:nucleoside deaminase [Aliifodinibius sp. S!AR15-10]MDR8389984.1 nucleoside deaminase [Aliifodinibius sp. S!AR15-10]